MHGVRLAALLVIIMATLPGWPRTLHGAAKPDLWSKWQAQDPKSDTRIDHNEWKQFLATYLISDHPSGINRVRYAAVAPADKKKLEGYVRGLEGVAVSRLNRAEQKAYWINLYNVLTVKIILDHYPVESIRNIAISPGWFSRGPWGAKLLEIEGEKVCLDDIEHRILRPIWKDNRVHYAVNCASLGCPNLQPLPFTAENTDELLDKGAREYINHVRGVRLEGGTLHLSSIYKWFQVDFEGTETGVIKHLLLYAEKPLAAGLEGFEGTFKYDYDWGLNRP